MGAWIEIFTPLHNRLADHVAPYMGAWIEMTNINLEKQRLKVAPYMGAWIEIIGFDEVSDLRVSLPTWGRGLKWHRCNQLEPLR